MFYEYKEKNMFAYRFIALFALKVCFFTILIIIVQKVLDIVNWLWTLKFKED